MTQNRKMLSILCYLRMYLEMMVSLNLKTKRTIHEKNRNDIVHLISRQHHETLYLIIKYLEYSEQISFLQMFLDAMIYSVDIICLNSLIKNKDILELIASLLKK